MGSGEATVIKLNNKESPAEEGDNDGDEDNERIRDNRGGGAEDWALLDLDLRRRYQQKLCKVESRWSSTTQEPGDLRNAIVKVFC